MKTWTIGYIDKSSDRAVYVDVKAESIDAAIRTIEKYYSPYRIFLAKQIS